MCAAPELVTFMTLQLGQAECRHSLGSKREFLATEKFAD